MQVVEDRLGAAGAAQGDAESLTGGYVAGGGEAYRLLTQPSAPGW